jgi:hypothetical protein
MSEKNWNDPETYRLVSKPFDSIDEANAAMNAFADDVTQARKKHRIAELVGQCQVTAIVDGEETATGMALRLGNAIEHEALAARLLGDIQRWRQAFIGKLLGAK